MGWYELSSLISDARVKFLLGFVILAIVVAITVTIFEFRMKKKKELQETKAEDESYVARVRGGIKGDKTPREKLDVIDSVAKAYFKDNFGTNFNSSYSHLIKEFEETGRPDFLAFSKSIFAVYYSSVEITDDKVAKIAREFIDAIRKKERDEELSKIPNLKERILRFLSVKKDSFSLRVRHAKVKWRRVQNEKKRVAIFKQGEIKKQKVEVESQRRKEEQILVKKKAERMKLVEEKRIELENIKLEKEKKAEEEEKERARLAEEKKIIIRKKVSFTFFKKKETEKEDKEKSKKLDDFKSGVKPKNEWRILKDSFNGGLEMYPPTRRASGKVLIRKLNKIKT